MFSRAVEAEVASRPTLPTDFPDPLSRPPLVHPFQGAQRPSAALHPTFSPKLFASGFVVPAPTVPSVPARLSGTVFLFSRSPSPASPFLVSRFPSPVLCLPPLPPPSFVPTAAAPLPEQLRLRPPERPAPRFEIRYLYYRTSGGESLPLHSETSSPASPFPLRSTPCMALPRTVRRRKSRPVGRCRESNRRDYGKILRYALRGRALPRGA